LTRLLLRHPERLGHLPLSSQYLGIRPASQMPTSLLFQPSPKQTILVSRHHLHLPDMPMKRNWREARGDEAGAVNEARATVAIIARTENHCDPGEIVENETEPRIGTLVEERVETAMIGGVMILGIEIISVVGIAENGMTGVGAQAKTGLVPVLEIDGEQAIARAAAVERGETVPVVAIGYVLQVLLPETPSSNHGS